MLGTDPVTAGGWMGGVGEGWGGWGRGGGRSGFVEGVAGGGGCW